MDTNFSADPAVVSVVEGHQPLAARTANLKILTPTAYTEAAEWLKTIKTSLAQLEEQRIRITKPLNNALRETNMQAKAAALPFIETETRIKAALVAYSQEQERLRLIEQRKQDEEARKERERLQAIADAARAKATQEAEARRKAADEAATAGRAEEAARLQAAAARIEEKAEAKAETFENRASTTVAQVVSRGTPKVAGVGMRDNWTFRIKDPSQVAPGFLTPDLEKIRKVVKSLKLEAAELVGAGVEIYNEPVMASGRA